MKVVRRGVLFAGVVSLSVGSLEAVKLPALPEWNAADKVKLKEKKLVLSGALLTSEAPKEKGKEEAPRQVEVIIEAVEAKPDLPGQQSLDADSVVSGEYLTRYFGAKPEGHLIDPQKLLSMQERADLSYALEQHSRESPLPIYVFLFDGAQQVPEEYSPQRVYDKLFPENAEPVVLVYYYMGAPKRAGFLLAGGASEKVPKWQVRELLFNAGHKAREKSAEFDQLGDFIGQLSMRLFWVEELLNELQVVGEAGDGHGLPVEKVQEKASKVEQVVAILEENLPEKFPVYVFWLLGGLAALVLSVIAGLRRKLRFPDSASPARLGAGRGAMCGGVMSYKNPRQPVTKQRKQFEQDFL